MWKEDITTLKSNFANKSGRLELSDTEVKQDE